MGELDRYYEVLGLMPGASADQIRQAYRDLVFVWHPDRYPGNPRLQQKAQEKLKEINEAYERLQAIGAAQHTGASQGKSEAHGPRPQAPASENRSAGSETGQAQAGPEREKKQGRRFPPWRCLCGVVHSGDQVRCWNCGRGRFGGSGRAYAEGEATGASSPQAGAGEHARSHQGSPYPEGVVSFVD